MTDGKTNIFHLDIFQQFLYIKGCCTSASEQYSVWDTFVENYHRKHTIEERDRLWAMVYREFYEPDRHAANKPLYWNKMLQFLAQYNQRNLVRVMMCHSKSDNIAIRAYLFRGSYYMDGSMTRVIPQNRIVSIFLRKEERHHENTQLGLVSKDAYEDTSIY